MNMSLIGMAILWFVLFILGVFFTKPITIERAAALIIPLTMILVIIVEIVMEKK